MRIGVEVGGTFTDLVAIGKDGIRVVKVPSTPSNPDEGAFAALQRTTSAQEVQKAVIERHPHISIGHAELLAGLRVA